MKRHSGKEICENQFSKIVFEIVICCLMIQFELKMAMKYLSQSYQCNIGHTAISMEKLPRTEGQKKS